MPKKSDISQTEDPTNSKTDEKRSKAKKVIKNPKADTKVIKNPKADTKVIKKEKEVVNDTVIKIEVNGVKLELALKPGEGLAGSNVIEPTQDKPKRKKGIPKGVRDDAWDHWIGKNKGIHKCLCCGIKDISQNDFECGHIIPESAGGPMTVNNLKPICSKCNKSMGTTNLEDYKNTHYPISKIKNTKQKINKNPNTGKKIEEKLKLLIKTGELTKCPGQKEEELSLLDLAVDNMFLCRTPCARDFKNNSRKHCDKCNYHYKYLMFSRDSICPCQK